MLAGLQLGGTHLSTHAFPRHNHSMHMDDLQRIHVFFTGKVQGVGFRQTVHDLAVELGIKGWVRNLPDMRVELVAEGDELDLKLLLGKLRSEFQVDKVEVRNERRSEPLKGFEILR